MSGISARIVCDDGTSATVNAPEATPGASCSVTQTGGQATITCDDGTSVFVEGGTPGAPGTPGTSGTDGETGASCSVEQDETGAVTIVCEDGTEADLGRPLPGDPTRPAGELGLGLMAGTISVGTSDGLGTETRMDGSLDGVFDPSGEFMYFVDTFNDTFRRFGLRTQRVVTLAGSPGRKGVSDGIGADVTFNGPRGVAMHPDGNRVFIADGFNCTIRQYEVSTREVTTIAGQPGECAAADGAFEDARFRLTIGMVMDATGRYLYAADRGNNVIRRIDLEDRVVETIAGRLPTDAAGEFRGHADGVGADAKFAGPGGIDISADRKVLYINDTFNNVIRSLILESEDASEVHLVTTIAGAPGQAGNVDGVGGDARFAVSQGLARAADGLFVAGFHGSIRRIDLETFEVTTVAGENGASGSTDGPAHDARFGVSFGILSHPDGRRIYYMDRGNNSIRLYDRVAQTVSTVMGASEPTGWRDGKTGVSRFNGPRAMYANADGSRVYVSDRNNHVVRNFDVATGELTTIAGLPGNGGFADGLRDEARFTRPDGLWADESETYLYVADEGNDSIRRIELATGQVTTLVGRTRVTGETSVDGGVDSALFHSPKGLLGHVDALDVLRLYVADYGSDLIRVVTLGANVEVSTLVGGGDGNEDDATAIDGNGLEAVFDGPQGLAITEDGLFLYVADALHHVIRKVDVTTGDVTTIAGDIGVRDAFDGTGDEATFAFPEGLSLHGNTLFVADRSNYSIRKVDLGTNTVSTLIESLGVSGGSGANYTPLDEARMYFTYGVVVAGDDIFITADQAMLRVADILREAP